MKVIKNILVMIIGISFVGCMDVIDVKLNTAPPKLVIDATIDWVKGTTGNEQVIKISTTTGYYEAEFPAVSGAKVSVTNSANKVFLFAETGKPGEYVCTDFVPLIGETFQLNIQLNGETYTASETLIAAPEITDEITQNNAGGMTGDEIEIQFSYQDDASKENYYMAGVKSDAVAFWEYSIESDEMFQGQKMVQYYSHEDLEIGDALNIRMYGISKKFFAYFKKILAASGSDDSPFPTTPTMVRGNITSQTDEKNFALGYFRLSEVSVRNHTIVSE